MLGWRPTKKRHFKFETRTIRKSFYAEKPVLTEGKKTSFATLNLCEFHAGENSLVFTAKYSCTQIVSVQINGPEFSNFHKGCKHVCALATCEMLLIFRSNAVKYVLTHTTPEYY